jgi:hypothetical protein
LKSLARFAPHGYESLFDDVVELWLGDSEISDAVLDDVGRLTNLEMLSLRDTKITNSQMVYLKGLTRLKWLSLSRTRITAEGLKHLTGLRNLEFVALNDMDISARAVAELERAVPGLVVERRTTVPAPAMAVDDVSGRDLDTRYFPAVHRRFDDPAKAAEYAAWHANEKCRKAWGRTPFSADLYPASERDGRWHWGEYDPAGPDGFSAEVSFSRDGTAVIVQINFSVDTAYGAYGIDAQ